MKNSIINTFQFRICLPDSHARAQKNGLIQLNSPHIPVNKFLFGIKCLRFIPACVYWQMASVCSNMIISIRRQRISSLNSECYVHCIALRWQQKPFQTHTKFQQIPILLIFLISDIESNVMTVPLVCRHSCMKYYYHSDDNGNSITHTVTS